MVVTPVKCDTFDSNRSILIGVVCVFLFLSYFFFINFCNLFASFFAFANLS